MSINMTSLLATAPTSSKIIISVDSYDGTKTSTTPYLKDASNAKSTLQKLNFQSIKKVFMLDEDSIVISNADKNGIDQLFYGKINATDDELQQVTNFTREASAFTFVPSTSTLYYIMATTDPVKRDDGAIFMLYDMVRPRTDNGFIKPNKEIKHIFAAKYSFNNGNMTLGNSTDIFERIDKPFNVKGYFTDLNGTWITFQAPGNNVNFTSPDEFHNDLFVFPTSLTQQPFKISNTIRGKTTVELVDITPSGNKVLWTVRDKSNDNLDIDIFSYDINTRKKKSYIKDLDLFTKGIYAVSDDFFVFTAFNNQTSKVYSCDMATGKVTARTGDDAYFIVEHYLKSRPKAIVSSSNITSPRKFSVLDLKTWKMTTSLETVDAEFMSQFEMHTATRFSFPGWNNEKVTGWLHKPAGFDPSKKYPAVIWVHGGPNGQENSNIWDEGPWSPVIYTSNGYFVIAVNFHGSPGHGKKFMESIYG